MSRRILITESERKEILSHYLNKNIITESVSHTENLSYRFSYISIYEFYDCIKIEGRFYAWPYLGSQKTSSSLTAKMRVYTDDNEKLENSKKFLEEVGLGEKYPNGIVGDIIVQFEKISESEWDEVQDEKRATFFKELSAKNSDDENKPYVVLIKDLVQGKDKFATFDVEYKSILNCSGKITSVSIEIPDETKQEEPVPAPEEKKTETETETETAPDEVEDAGLPEGDFADEVLTGNKKEEPGWFKRLLTREKTDLMKKLKFLEVQYI